MRRADPNETAEMAALYAQDGASLASVGARYGMSRQAVHQRLVAAGYEPKPRREAPHGGNRRYVTGCRCEPCRQGKARAQSTYRKRRTA